MTPRPRALALVALALVALSCRRRPSLHRGRAAVAGHWAAAPAVADPVRVIEGHYLADGVRRTDAAAAPPPYPARPLVSAARVADGWRFAAADGTLYAARDFLGPLRVVAAVPASARPARNAFHEGALGYVDAAGRAWVLDGGGVRALPLAHVVTLAFASARRAFAITAPGGLFRSDDGGRRFAAIELPAGDVPLALGLVRGVAVVASLRGRYTLSDAGELRPDADVPAPDEPARAGELTDVAPALLLPADPTRVAALADGALAIVDGDEVRVVDPRTRAVRRRTATPGQGCVVVTARGGFRVICTHDGWARAAFAPTAAGGWEARRDERRGDPMNDLLFDDRSDAWVAAGPCAPQREFDPRAFCVGLADGSTRPVEAPFTARPVDMRDGAALLVETGTDAATVRAVVLRGDAKTSLTLPVGAADARGLRWSDGALAVWSRRDGRPPVLHRGVFGPSGVAWSAHPAPAGAVHGFLGDAGRAYAVGRDVAALWRYQPGAGFARLAAVVRGDASALPLDPEALSYCAGPVCRVAGVLEWTAGVDGPPWFVARASAAPAAPPAWVPPPRRDAERAHYACEAGATVGVGPDLDEGVAVSGYALQWTPERDGVTVQWNGETFARSTRARLPPTVERTTLAAYAPVGATLPVALVDRCAGPRCETFLATAAGAQPFPLEHFPQPFRRDVVRGHGASLVALSRGAAHGVTVAQAVAFDPAGALVTAQRTVVVDAPPELVMAGTLDGRDGLWVPTVPRRWRFVPLVGEPTEETVADDGDLAPCPDAVASRGVMRRLDRGAELRGPGWAVTGEGWLVEETLEVTAHGLCVQAIAGGEARDASARGYRGDGTLVRSFALTTDGAGRLGGVAWRGRRRFILTCARVEARRTMAR